MATSRLLSLVSLTSLRGSLFGRRYASKSIIRMQLSRFETTTSCGGVRLVPPQVRFGLLKTFAVVVPFLYVGATISKEGAAFLEENDIFVPEDDDD